MMEENELLDYFKNTNTNTRPKWHILLRIFHFFIMVIVPILIVIGLWRYISLENPFLWTLAAGSFGLIVYHIARNMRKINLLRRILITIGLLIGSFYLMSLLVQFIPAVYQGFTNNASERSFLSTFVFQLPTIVIATWSFLVLLFYAIELRFLWKKSNQ